MTCFPGGVVRLQLTLLLCCCVNVSAWEIELKDQVSTRAAMVRLGGISRITGLAAEDAGVLQQIVLAPGPSRLYSRSLSASQIRKILEGRGVELSACEFSGAFRCVVTYAAAGISSTTAPSESGATEPISPREVVRPASYRARGGVALVQGVEEKLASAVCDQLIQLSGESIPWHVGITIPGRAVSDLPLHWSGLTMEGLEAASEGRHQLVACFTSESGDVRIPVEAVASRMVELVVPIRPIKRGEFLTADDVQLRYLPADADRHQVAQRVEEVVGRQVQVSLRAGEPIQIESLKKPILVKRREEVEVVARRAGITIKTKVRSIDEGALGDIVTVEKLDGSKDRFVARVTGVQQVEVCVSGATARGMTGR